MMFTKKYKSMNEQINPSQELVNKVIGSINITSESMNKTKKLKSGRTWLKPVVKFALPVLLIACAFCFQILGPGFWGTTDTGTNGGNWFSLVAYASADTTFEITKDMKVLLPTGNWIVEHRDGGIGVSWNAVSDENGEYIPGGFAIQGENMKSVNLESKNGTFNDNIKRRKLMSASDEELAAHFREHGHYGFYVNPVYLEGDDILNLQYFNWQPEKLINSRLEGNYKEYYSDIITITVTFDDGEVMTQTAEITIDEITGDMFAQIIG